MNKIDFTFFEFLNALQGVEGIIKCHSSVNNIEKYHFSSFFPKKGQAEKIFQVTPIKFLIHLEVLVKGIR